jgi:small GTP-binding protein domain
MFEHHSDHINQHDGERRLKVVIFGSYHSGKTSLVRAISPCSHGTEARNSDGTTTVAFDLGVREHDGIRIFFYGTPGQERFDVARQVVAFGLHMGLVVVDATRGMTGFEQHIISELKTHGVPCIVLANKTDLPGASSDLIRRDAGDGAIVMDVSARSGAGIDVLLDRIVSMASQM